MDDDEKSVLEVSVDWLASVVSSGDGWAVKRATYRKGVVPRVDPVFSWVDRAYKATGEMPPYETMKQRHPRFPWPAVPLPETFTTLELEHAYSRWRLVKFVNELNDMTVEGTVNEAYRHIREFATSRLPGTTPQGIQLTDPMLYVDVETDMVDFPSWGGVLGNRGVHRSDFVLVAARTNVGKSWWLVMAALDALRQGWDVVFYSLEMDADEVAKRCSMLVRADDMPSWFERQPGKLWVIQQSANKNGYRPSDLAMRVEQGSRTVVVVDYGELMRPESGGRTTEAWNKSAEVSQALQNVAKHMEIPVLAAVQDNRAAADPLQANKSGVETFSGSDYWGRDADIALRVRDEAGIRPGAGPTRVLEVVKTRHSGHRSSAYYRFDPEGDGIKLIDRVEYATLHSEIMAVRAQRENA